MMRIAKAALIALGTVGALASPMSSVSAQQYDWEGYIACVNLCYEGYPGRERECEYSCREAYGIPHGD